MSLLLLVGHTLFGQATTQDCSGAIAICQDVIYQPLSSNNSGALPSEVSSNTCIVGGESNSFWYIFTVVSDGILNFTLVPDEFGNDYDWILFDITNSSCENVGTDPSLMVSCNSWGLPGADGPTGISSSSGGVGNSNGPGDQLGPPFNEDVAVTTGQTMVLMINDFSGTPAGYTLDFSESTAEIFDVTPPAITDTEAACESVVVTFSENIDCESVQNEDFEIVQGGTTYTVSNIESACDGLDLFTNQLTIYFSPGLPANGEDFILSLTDAMGSVTDLCGNVAAVEDVTLSIDGIDIDAEITPSSCNEDNGFLDASNSSGGQLPYTFVLDGLSQTIPAFSNLAAGTYTLTITDDAGCITSQEVEIPSSNAANYNNGGDATTCVMSYDLQATLDPAFQGIWTSNDNVTFADATNPTTTVTADAPGSATLTWSIDDGAGCSFTDDIEVVFTDLQVTVTSTNALCNGICDGTAEAIVIGGATPYTFNWSGGTPSADMHSVTELCPGNVTLSMSDDNNCSYNTDLNIEQSFSFSIDSIIGVDEYCRGFCDGQITIYAQNAVLYSIYNGFSPSSSSNFDNVCAGSYDIIATDNNGCTDEGSVNISFPFPPEASFSVTNPIVLWNNPVFEMNNNSNDFVNSYWEFGYPDGILFSTEEDPIFTSPTAEIGEYQIQLVVEDSRGCTDSTLRTVIIRDDVHIYIPNSFSPNEDGVNDLFRPIINDVDPADYSFTIYDRWGSVVFSSNTLEHGWNGAYRSNKNFYIADGVYSWILNFLTKTTSERIVKRGHITVIR